MRPVLCLFVLAALAAAGEVVAFKDVHVVPLDGGGNLGFATVVVRDGKILAVGDKVWVPKGATVVDGRGKTLLPGLADMHVHNWYEEEHVLFLARGVTTVRNLWGRRMHLRWRAEIEAGERLGPNLYTTGPIVDGAQPVWENSVTVLTPAAAAEVVARLKREGYPSIKVYNKLHPETYAALVKACRTHGIRVTGHVPFAVGIEGALAARQDCIEHLDGYFGVNWNFDEARLARLVQQTVKAGAWNCPTLVVYEKLVPEALARKLHAAPEMRFVPPRLRATWDPARDFRTKGMTPETFRRLQEYVGMERKLVGRLHAAGAGLLLGTDAGNPFVIAGWSAHEELANLVRSGLTPHEALRVATTNAARYLGEEEQWGTVTPGKRADLILVEGNPLDDIADVGRIAGVMVRGRWLPKEKLDAMLEEVARSYERPKRRFAGLPALPEGDAGPVRYEITWNGLVVGEERFVRVGDTLHVQQVNDPPWRTTRFTTIRIDADGRVLGLRVKLDDTEAVREVALGDDEADGDACLAAWVAMGRRWRDLEIGAERELTFREPGDELKERVVTRAMKVQRDGPRAFTVQIKRDDGVFTSRLVFGEDGVPESLETVLQQGTVRYRRVR